MLTFENISTVQPMICVHNPRLSHSGIYQSSKLALDHKHHHQHCQLGQNVYWYGQAHPVQSLQSSILHCTHLPSLLMDDVVLMAHGMDMFRIPIKWPALFRLRNCYIVYWLYHLHGYCCRFYHFPPHHHMLMWCYPWLGMNRRRKVYWMKMLQDLCTSPMLMWRINN